MARISQPIRGQVSVTNCKTGPALSLLIANSPILLLIITYPGPTQPHLLGPGPAPALATAPVPAPANDDVLHGDVRDLGDSVPRGDTLASDTSL